MLTWQPKYEEEVVQYGVDWSATLAADEISTTTWEVVSGDAVIDSDDFTSQGTTVIVSGGTETTVFKNTIVTVGGFTYVEEATLAINDVADPAVPRTARKRVLIEMCAEELRLAGYEWNFSPEEYVSTLRKLDGICAAFPDCGYNAPSTFGAGEVDDLSGLKDAEITDFALLLAEAAAPAIGKTLSPTSMRRIASARVRLQARYAVLPTMQLAPGTPLGSGNRRQSGSGGTFTTIED